MRGHRSMPVLACADVEAMAQFFADGLGFQIAGHWSDDDGWTFSIVQLDLVTVAFQRGVPTPADTMSAYIYIDDANGMAEDVIGRGVSLAREVTDAFYGCREFDVKTPEGHLLCFGQDLHPGEDGPGL